MVEAAVITRQSPCPVRPLNDFPTCPTSKFISIEKHGRAAAAFNGQFFVPTSADED